MQGYNKRSRSWRVATREVTHSELQEMLRMPYLRTRNRNVSGFTTSGLGPLGVAVIIVAIGASLGGPTGYAINPARDLGPRIAHALLPIKGKGGSDWGYAWVPVVGPVIGGVLAGVASGVLLPA